jgi:hypothetical protein
MTCIPRIRLACEQPARKEEAAKTTKASLHLRYRSQRKALLPQIRPAAALLPRRRSGGGEIVNMINNRVNAVPWHHAGRAWIGNIRKPVALPEMISNFGFGTLVTEAATVF